MRAIFAVKRGLGWVMDHDLALCCFLAFFTLTLTGAGNILLTGALGIFLCLMGLMQKNIQVDLWTFLPLTAYCLWGMVSSFFAYGVLTEGYGIMHLLLPVFYLLMACLGQEETGLTRRLFLIWASASAAWGIGSFLWTAALDQSVRRLGVLMGSPNALGIFLAAAWLMLAEASISQTGEEKERTGLRRLLPHLEPLLLAALGMTLSMGSYLSLAVGIAVLFAVCLRDSGFCGAFQAAGQLLARTALGVGTGLLAYLAAARTGQPWLCFLFLLYIAAMVFYWKGFCGFLARCPIAAWGVTLIGVLAAGAAVLLRPSAAATFGERLEMMQSGLHYLAENPLLGVGPYRWRALDYADGGIYFSTWHIHNVFIHIGAELGVPAMTALAIPAVRCFLKKKGGGQLACGAAFLAHNLLDTSFFYPGISVFALFMAGEPREKGKTLPEWAAKVFFVLTAALFGLMLWDYFRRA